MRDGLRALMMRSHTLKGRIGHVHQCIVRFRRRRNPDRHQPVPECGQYSRRLLRVGFYERECDAQCQVCVWRRYAGNPGGSAITYTPMANATSTGTFALGASTEQYTSYNYTTVRNQLLTESDTLQSSAYSTLPTTSPFPSNDTLWVSSAEQRAIGLPPTNTNGSTSGDTIGGFDGVVGIISNEELAAGGYTADWTKSAPANSKQYYMLGTIEHELSEVMGRFSYDGTNGINNAPELHHHGSVPNCQRRLPRPLRATAPNTGSDYSRSITALTPIITGTTPITAMGPPTATSAIGLQAGRITRTPPATTHSSTTATPASSTRSPPTTSI